MSLIELKFPSKILSYYVNRLLLVCASWKRCVIVKNWRVDFIHKIKACGDLNERFIYEGRTSSCIVLLCPFFTRTVCCFYCAWYVLENLNLCCNFVVIDLRSVWWFNFMITQLHVNCSPVIDNLWMLDFIMKSWLL